MIAKPESPSKIGKEEEDADKENDLSSDEDMNSMLNRLAPNMNNKQGKMEKLFNEDNFEESKMDRRSGAKEGNTKGLEITSVEMRGRKGWRTLGLGVLKAMKLR